jgi:hypothetical protein
MPYSAEISRSNPSCLMFLVDQSSSMSDPFGGQPGRRKADGVADAINRLLANLIIKCTKAEGVRDYFHIGVIGYGSRVGPVLGGTLAERSLVPLSEVADNPLRVEERTKKVEDGTGGLVDQTVKVPVWFEPLADGNTPMCQALEGARQVVAEFIGRCSGCFPPIVLNITDGEANDGNPEPVSAALRDLASSDGNVVLFNAHISSRADRPIEFSDSEGQLPDEHARLLFRMSSPLPPKLRDGARAEGFPVSESSRGFVFNADLVSVIRFLDIGTRVSQNLR